MNNLHKVLNADLATAEATVLLPLNEIELDLVSGGDGGGGGEPKNLKALDGNPAI